MSGREHTRPPDRCLRPALGLTRLAILLILLWLLLALASLAARDLRARDDRIGPAPARTAAPARPLGVTVQWEGANAATRRAALARLREAGFGWVRLRAGWEAIEPQKSRFAWRTLDAWLADIAAAGLEPVLVLDGSPAWAQGPLDQGAGSPYAPPHDLAEFAAFAGAVATRYAKTVRFYQVWDEPNIAPHWGQHHIDPVGYAQLLRAAAAALRAADPDAVVLAAALAPTQDRGHLAIDEPFFLQRMIAAGAAGSFDAVAVQPFGFGHGPTHARRAVETLNFQRAALIRRTLVQAGLAQVPIWAARFGWNTRGDSPWATVTPADQARYAAEARAVAARWPWLVALGWAVDQPALPATDPFWGFALTDSVLAALAGPPAALPAARGAHPAWRLAGLLALALLALAAGARTVAALPLRAWQARVAAWPAWALGAVWAGLIGVYYLATAPPLIAACWLAGMALAAARPAPAVWLALALLPFHYQHKEVAAGLWQVAVPPAAAAALALLPALWRALRPHPPALPRARLIWTDWLALLWLPASLPALANVWQRQAYARGLLELVIVPLLLYAAVRLLIPARARDMRAALGALAAGGLLVALMGLIGWAGGGGVEVDGVRRLVGPHFSPNHTALYLVRSLFVALGLALAWHGRERAWGLLAAALIGGALLLTASRGGLALGLPVGLAVCFWLWAQRGDLPLGGRVRAVLRRPWVRAALVALPVVACLVLFAGEARLLNRQSVDSRLILWQAAAGLWQAHPLAGVGPYGFFWGYAAFLPAGVTLEPSLQHPHNALLEVATGWGVAGLLWLAALLGLWTATAVRVVNGLPAGLQWPAIGLTAALAAALAHGMVDAFLALPDLAGWLLAALGLWALCIERRGASGE